MIVFNQKARTQRVKTIAKVCFISQR